MPADDVPPAGAVHRRGHRGSQGKSGQPAGETGLMGLNLRYFAIRAALFGVVLAVVLLVGVGGLLGFALALVISGLLSYPLALRQRRAVLRNIAERRGGGPQ
ncbi:Protein of unknown function (DUF4229) [Frankia sp. EI5c]|uniref:DUF4229 domain-containing protein n=1 Tax=Frankia sp. EI5c TaxID=683316 RepID=UPI0007C3D43E|nr:DUF4229 domain-containing protein [Frankia sp. EI5c]OAA26445.1 Protein of unknown function (DUF4229) [Frankia sp. EI5c]